jgi:hypothetical protein
MSEATTAAYGAEVIFGIAGTALLWHAMGWEVALAVVLLMGSANARRALDGTPWVA